MIRKAILVIWKPLCKSIKECCFYWLDYFFHLLNKRKIFHLFRRCFQRFMENLCTTHSTVIAFMASISSIFPLVGLTKLMVYLKKCHWMLKPVFHRIGILFFLLLPSYGCFRVTYVNVNGASRLSLRILLVYQGVGCFRRIMV